MANWQSSTAQIFLEGPQENKKSRLDARRKLRLVLLITKDPYVKDVYMGIVAGNNECICRRLRKWKRPVSRKFLLENIRDKSQVCRRCKECTRSDEGLLILEVS